VLDEFLHNPTHDDPVWLTFVSVGHKDARHELFLAVVAEGVSDHDLLLSQLTLEVEAIAPVKLDLSCRTFNRKTNIRLLKPS